MTILGLPRDAWMHGRIAGCGGWVAGRGGLGGWVRGCTNLCLRLCRSLWMTVTTWLCSILRLRLHRLPLPSSSCLSVWFEPGRALAIQHSFPCVIWSLRLFQIQNDFENYLGSSLEGPTKKRFISFYSIETFPHRSCNAAQPCHSRWAQSPGLGDWTNEHTEYTCVHCSLG